MLKFWTREFWKPKPKSPATILSNLLDEIEEPDDYLREKYLRKHMSAIKHAMIEDREPSMFYTRDFSHLSDDDIDVLEAKNSYLVWHYDILLELCSTEDGMNTAKLPFAAQYFLEETSDDRKEAFETLFMLDPALAIHNLAPAMLFKNEICEKMKLLSVHEDPALYFECFNAINFSEDEANTLNLSNRLVDATLTALNNLLSRNPDAVFFSDAPGHIVPNYLDYLPEGTCKNHFIADNIELIEVAVRKIAADISNHHVEEFEDIFTGFSEESRPAQLVELRNLIVSERVKKCFRLAADPTCPELAETVFSLDGERSAYIKTYTAYDDFMVTEDGILHARHPNPFIPVYEFVRLENPSAAADAKDEDTGADSKYLWMIRKSDQLLVAAFTKAKVTQYLADQTDYVVGELPTAMEWQESFCREPKSFAARLPELE